MGISIADTSGCCSPHRAGTPSISLTPRGHDGPVCPRLLLRSGLASGIPPMILFNKHFCLCSSSALGRTQPQPSAAPQGGERGSPRPPGHGVPWKGMGRGMEPIPPVPAGSTAQCPVTTAPRVGGWQGCLEPPLAFGSGGQWADPPNWDQHMVGGASETLPQVGSGIRPPRVSSVARGSSPGVSQPCPTGKVGRGRVQPTCSSPSHDPALLQDGKASSAAGGGRPTREPPYSRPDPGSAGQGAEGARLCLSFPST